MIERSSNQQTIVYKGSSMLLIHPYRHCEEDGEGRAGRRDNPRRTTQGEWTKKGVLCRLGMSRTLNMTGTPLNALSFRNTFPVSTNH